MIHSEKHLLAGQIIKINKCELRILDWWDRVRDVVLSTTSGALAFNMYNMRTKLCNLPTDDHIVCGIATFKGTSYFLIHDSELRRYTHEKS